MIGGTGRAARVRTDSGPGRQAVTGKRAARELEWDHEFVSVQVRFSLGIGPRGTGAGGHEWQVFHSGKYYKLFQNHDEKIGVI